MSRNLAVAVVLVIGLAAVLFFGVILTMNANDVEPSGQISGGASGPADGFE